MSLDAVRNLCDASTYRNAEQIVVSNAVTQTARTENLLFAQVVGGSTYTVRIELKESEPPKARCTCPAARRMPFCKHAVAVLIAWVQTPERFVETQLETPPPKKAMPRAKRETAERTELQEQSVAQAAKLALDLARRGLLNLGEEQIELLRTLKPNLESLKARRLAQAVDALANLLRLHPTSPEPHNEYRYAQQLVNLWLTVRALQEHYAGRRPLPPAQYEEMLGRTWRDKDLLPCENLRLAELAYENIVTPTGFRLDISHLIDLENGTLYREMKIVPLQVRFADPEQLEYKPARPTPFRAVRAGLYPGYAPQRIKIYDAEPLLERWDTVYAQCVSHAIRSVHEARARLIQHASDPFAPPLQTALIAPAHLVWADKQAWWADESGEMMPLTVQTLQNLLARSSETLDDLTTAVPLDTASVAPAEPMESMLADWSGQPLFGWLGLLHGHLCFVPISILTLQGVRLLRCGEVASLLG